MITKLLIANRGEIACRIVRTCRRLGIFTVAVYSDADRAARHVSMADEAISIGAPPAAQSYLRGDRIIAAAQRSGADAIHPGYGFLAENADFAAHCRAANLIFVGPSSAAIAQLGDKGAARRLMAQAGVPLLPGYDGERQDDATLQAAAATIGFPLMVKAAAGGGGKGMRPVSEPAALAEALQAARREARQAFGSDRLILEQLLPAARHIEVQIFGDSHGNIIHLGERDCSLQRRQQKVIEEAPSPTIDAAMRNRFGAAAVQAARAVAYENAGTVEFLYDGRDAFYFLEINTRIQVEHPLTEMISGVDLVEWQLRIAEGERLPLLQKQVTLSGHAIEARIYAEDPASAFLPITGDILLWREPPSADVRVESGLLPADTISIHYDPMVAKLIAYGADRRQAQRKLLAALARTRLLGITSNLPFLQMLLRHQAFASGQYTTDFIEENIGELTPPAPAADTALAAAALYCHMQHSGSGYWRNSPNRPPRYTFNEQPVVEIMPLQNGYRVNVGDLQSTVSVALLDNGDLALTRDGHRQTFTLARAGADIWVASDGATHRFTLLPLLPKPQKTATSGGSLRAPMPGVVLELQVAVGDQVEAGQPLLKLEAMKMEHTIRSSASGVVSAIYYQAGDQVDADQQLLAIES